MYYWICFYCGCQNARDWWRCNFCNAPKREPRFRSTPDWEPDFEVPDTPYFYKAGTSMRGTSYEEKTHYY